MTAMQKKASRVMLGHVDVLSCSASVHMRTGWTVEIDYDQEYRVVRGDLQQCCFSLSK